MAATSISVARILQLRIPIAWQEAVAVASVSDTECGTHGTPLTLENCLISASGDLRLASDILSRPGESLSSMQLLEAMLDGQSAPPELQALAATADDPLAAFPSEHGGDRLPFDLGAFVRADPEAEIARLATRALTADAETRAALEIDRLRAAVPSQPAPALVPSTRRQGLTWKIPKPTRAMSIGLAAVMVVAAIATVGMRVLERAGAPEPGVAPPDENSVAAAPADVNTADAASASAPAIEPPHKAAPSPATTRRTGVTASSTTPPATGARTPPRLVGRPPAAGAADASTAPRRFVPADSIGTTAAVALPGVVLAPAAVPAVRDEAPGLEAAGTVTSFEPSALEAGASTRTVAAMSDSSVYSSEDEGVEPPVLVRPQLPSEPKADSEQSGSYIELVIDEHGQVQQVRLKSSDLSLNDRMIVAAAKAWQFRPATRAGRPVPYTLRLPVTC